jgi:quinol-cytochrome oxidoreductase complex cytochrome b subunit
MKNAEAPQTQAPLGQRLSLLDKLRQSFVWRSIFRQGYPNTDENRALVMVNFFFLHIHPVKVRKHTLKITYTWGLGIISTILLLILVVTGGILMFHYVPSTELAYDSIQKLETSVTFGMLLRNMHRWAAHLMVLVVFLHMCRVFYTGGYKRPREFNWVMGVILWVTTLLLSFTGYLLPFDQLSYWAITIASNIARYVPLIGEQAQYYLLGGTTVGQATLIRFYGLHIFLLPAILFVLLAVHFWRIRKDGGLSAPLTEFAPLPVKLPAVGTAGPGSREKSEEISPQRPEKTYGLMALVKRVSPMVEKGSEDTVFSWPHLLVMELLATLGTTVLLFIMSLFANAPLRAVANPAITEDPAKAPWFFSALQELLLHMNPTLAGLVVTSVTLIG